MHVFFDIQFKRIEREEEVFCLSIILRITVRIILLKLPQNALQNENVSDIAYNTTYLHRKHNMNNKKLTALSASSLLLFIPLHLHAYFPVSLLLLKVYYINAYITQIERVSLSWKTELL